MAKNMISSNLNDNHSCDIRPSSATTTISNNGEYVNKSFFFLIHTEFYLLSSYPVNLILNHMVQ